MAQIAVRINPVTDALLQYFSLGKTAVGLALPELYIVTEDVKDPTGTGHQRHFSQVIAKGTEQFLRQPGRAQEPLTLRAISDDDFRFTCSHDRENS